MEVLWLCEELSGGYLETVWLCEELVGGYLEGEWLWRISGSYLEVLCLCEELSVSYLQEMMGLVLGGLLFYSIFPFTNLYSFFPLLL